MGHSTQDGMTHVILSVLLFVAYWYKPCIGKHQDDICGSSNGRRLYLELGERGVLTALNVTTAITSRLQTGSPSGNLSSHEQCSLELITCPACVVTITFHHLDLPHHCGGGNMLMDTPCRCDYVWLSEPPYEDVSGVPFCGLMASGNSPLKYRSQTRSLAITLLYSGSHKHAFTLEYTAERNRHVITGSPGESTVVSPSSNMNHSGILTSPFFPAQYPRDLGVEYVINCLSENNNTCKVRIVFRDFLISPVSIMEFYDWNGNRLEVTSGALFRPPVILTSGPSMLVRFYANGGSGLGFKAVYSFITDNFQDSAVVPITDCGGYVENMGGAITMMNMVDHGVKTYDCIWLIRPPKNYLHLRTHLYLKVATFRDMAGSTELQVLQGLTSEKPALDTFRFPAAHAQASRQREHVVPVNVGFYVSLRGTFGSLSRLAIVYAAFSYIDCFTGPDFLCQNHRCIPSQLSCDGFDHCGDNSDEPNTCYQEWEAEPQDRRWYSHTPNYYFPKMDRYPDLKTATLVFIVSCLGLLLLITALILLLYRMGSRARQQREIQNRLQTISELLDGARMDESAPPDDPPVYEAPPDYDEVIKVFLEPIGTQRMKKKKCQIPCRSSRRSRNSPGTAIRSGEVNVGSEQNYNQPASLLQVVLPNPVSTSSAPGLLDLTGTLSPVPINITSRSCQTTPIPDSPPPPYSDAVVTAGPSSQLISPSQPSTAANLSSNGNATRQSWLLFRQESSEDQLMSVVITGVARPSEFQENGTAFQQIPESNMINTSGSDNSESSSRQQSPSITQNSEWQDSEMGSTSTSAVVPVDRMKNPTPILLQPLQSEFLDPQHSPLIKIGKDCIYRGRILEVKKIPRPLISFDDLIAERISQAFLQLGRTESLEPSGLLQRRCASHNSLCPQSESEKTQGSEHPTQYPDLKFRSHPQIKDDLNLILEGRNKKPEEGNDNNDNTELQPEPVASDCNCEGACGCATIGISGNPPMESNQRKRHVRSHSVGFATSSLHSRDLRDLDIYFSLHEFGLGAIKPIPSLTCGNSTDVNDQKLKDQPISPHKLWQKPSNLERRQPDNTQYIL